MSDLLLHSLIAVLLCVPNLELSHPSFCINMSRVLVLNFEKYIKLILQQEYKYKRSLGRCIVIYCVWTWRVWYLIFEDVLIREYEWEGVLNTIDSKRSAIEIFYWNWLDFAWSWRFVHKLWGNHFLDRKPSFSIEKLICIFKIDTQLNWTQFN